MKNKECYTTGEFARLAHVTVRTVRWYDREGILKPSFHTDSGARLYTDQDLARLQQVLLFKYLGFSLQDIREMTANFTNKEELQHSLFLQKKMTETKITQLESVLSTLEEMNQMITEGEKINWSEMLADFYEQTMEETLKDQYRNAANISARIRLHRDYSMNKQGWYPWLMEQIDIKQNMQILEVGCGNGQLWLDNLDRLPASIHAILSDSSEGMVEEVQNKFSRDERFVCRTFSLEDIPYADHSFDLVIANHVLFYCHDLDRGLSEIRRVLKKNGRLACTTYSHLHMKEITELVQSFDSSIVLSRENLYENFGLENGVCILKKHFANVIEKRYEDAIVIDDPQPLISYILSCHGNQNDILLNHYHEFYAYVEDKVKGGFHITKDAGIFLCNS